jgi:hypothetical protein
MIGWLYEDRTATRPELTWFWSIIVMGPPRDSDEDRRAGRRTPMRPKAQFAPCSRDRTRRDDPTSFFRNQPRQSPAAGLFLLGCGLDSDVQDLRKRGDAFEGCLANV